MNWKAIYLEEYNGDGTHQYGTRIIHKDKGKGWLNKPLGFIHILAHANPEFYFNYFDLGYDFANQTKEEWEKIYVLVMQEYYKQEYDPKYNEAYQVALDDIGGELPTGFGGGEQDTSNTSDDITIKSCKVKIYDETNYQHSVTKTIGKDESFAIDAEAKVKNKTDYDSYDTDIDYRVDSSRNNFDSNATKLASDTVDIDAEDTIAKHMGRTIVHVSSDGKYITLSKGSHSKTFSVINGKATFYIFLDVQNRGDKDISSQTNHDEYAKVTVFVSSKPTQFRIL